MKQAWSDLKSFVTVAMVVLLFVIVIANVVFQITIADNILILVTNLITAVFTYYFTKKDSNEIKNNENVALSEKTDKNE